MSWNYAYPSIETIVHIRKSTLSAALAIANSFAGGYGYLEGHVVAAGSEQVA